jgi:hypothetical protein
MTLRTNYTPTGEPVGGRLTTKWHSIDAIEHATDINTNTTAVAANAAAIALKYTLPGSGIPAGDIASNAITNAKIADDAVGLAELSATGTASSATFLRGDNSWASTIDGGSP